MSIESAVEERRCRASFNDRRCQLWNGHADSFGEVEHAHQWRPVVPRAPGQPPGGLLPSRLLLWTDEGQAREVEPGAVRLRWAAMGRD